MSIRARHSALNTGAIWPKRRRPPGSTVFLADNVALFGATPEAISYTSPVHRRAADAALGAGDAYQPYRADCHGSTTYLQPYHVARKFAALDQLSGGRAGWNLVTSGSDAEAANFGLDHQLAHDARYAIAAEHVQVVKALWDSFADDAILADKASGRFYDPAKLRRVDHAGEHFRVAGPLQTGRPPQGTGGPGRIVGRRAGAGRRHGRSGVHRAAEPRRRPGLCPGAEGQGAGTGRATACW
jgi:hypothetical protein